MLNPAASQSPSVSIPAGVPASPATSLPLSAPPPSPTAPSGGCCAPSCGCAPPNRPAPSRREFMQVLGATTAALSLSRLDAVAGPFLASDIDHLVPADKKLSPEWIRSLYARGQPTIYSLARNELNYIGMPVGGICAGQVYLGGDGRLWHWDVLNLSAPPGWSDSSGGHYAKPPPPSSPFEQGFAISAHALPSDQGQPPVALRRFLDRRGFSDITFRGQYPIGAVEFRDPALPIAVSLEAFSPFIPLDESESGLPVTVMSYTVTNNSAVPLVVSIAGWLQNPVALGSMKSRPDVKFRRNSIEHAANISMLHCTAVPLPVNTPDPARRPDVLFENFEHPTYAQCQGGWTATGTAFADGPLQADARPAYMGPLKHEGRFTVNTHNTRRGEDVRVADTHIGTLTSREFVIDRRYISFRIGGGKHPGQTCLNLLVDGAPVRTATGRDSNIMSIENFDVREFAGRPARLQIVDAVTGGWGQIGLDDIVFCDEPREAPFVLEQQPDYGSMALGVLGDAARRTIMVSLPSAPREPRDLASVFDEPPLGSSSVDASPVGGASSRAVVAPGASEVFTFVLAWHFPTPNRDQLAFLTDIEKLRRHYATRFSSAAEAAAYVGEHFERLASTTRAWHAAWYDSTLPHWFLERTFINTSIAASQTCYRFDNNRFYGWEGTYCCAGTCTHVWQYAHSLARVFPTLERSARELVDYGLAFNEGGALDYRGEAARSVAHDGQCGTILRAFREHQMSADPAFLARIWPRVKQSIEFLIREDKDQDGVLEGSQYNTLDAAWFGPMAWISSLYVAALRAGREMALEMGDSSFAARCASLAAKGSEQISRTLYNGEYFIHKADPAHPEANNTNDGCHIDQLFGASTARQLGLGRLLDAGQTRSALRSLWTYNFTPDVGPYRDGIKASIQGGRWYAMPGEGGLLMCTFPKGGADRATGKGRDAWAAGYFNECMNGFEYQVAAHMIGEGLVQEGLAITRMLHDRYHAARRNPWNEIECSDHYARSMASHAVYLAACGFACHGPRGELEFAPRLSPEHFKAAFTSAQGWGVFEQRASATSHVASLSLSHGSLRLQELRLATLADLAATPWTAAVNDRAVAVIAARHDRDDGRPGIRLTFSDPLLLNFGDTLRVTNSA